MLKTAWVAAQNYLNELDFFLFFWQQLPDILSANQKMAIHRLSQNLSLTECFEINWFKQLVFFVFILYISLYNSQDQIPKLELQV